MTCAALGAHASHRPLLLEQARLVALHFDHVAHAAACTAQEKGEVRAVSIRLMQREQLPCVEPGVGRVIAGVQAGSGSGPSVAAHPHSSGAPLRGHSTLLWPYLWQIVQSAIICLQSRETCPRRPHLQDRIG